MRRRTLAWATSGLAVATLVSAGTATTRAGSTTGVDPGCQRFEVAAGDRPALQIVNGHGQFEVERRGSRITVRMGGRALEPQATERAGSVLLVRGEREEVVLMVGLFKGPGDGQVVYSPDLDPATADLRFGFHAEPAEGGSRDEAGSGTATTLRVSRVCPGGAADRAGLREGNLIVEVEGVAASTASLHRSAAGQLPEESLQLTVLREGRRERLGLAAEPQVPWPPSGDVESYLRIALGGGRRP